jgi:hypothetical protein
MVRHRTATFPAFAPPEPAEEVRYVEWLPKEPTVAEWYRAIGLHPM